jgi:membrane-associated phospholipid phosphatase
LKYLNQLIREKSVLFLLVPFLLGVLFLMIAYGKGPSHLLVNQWNSPVMDTFFKYITYLGDGAVFALVIFVLAFVRFGWALYELMAALMTLVIDLIAKQILFHGMPRPTKYFENQETLHLVEGVKMHSSNSFPSGHTITVFAIFMILVLIVKNKYLKFLFVMIGILAGFSRVYLSQHFLGDVFSGAIIGSLIAVCSCALADAMHIFKKSTWVDKNLSQLFGEKHEQ